MLACYKWLARFASLLLISHMAYAKEPAEGFRFLLDSEHASPEKVVQYLKNVPKSKKILAEGSYKHAQKHAARGKNTSWGAVYKASMDSIDDYPTGKALLLGIEADLKMGGVGSDPTKGLQRMVKEFDFAIAVESYERSLDDSDRDKLVPYRACLKHYIDTGRADADCVPLQWAGIVPVK